MQINCIVFSDPIENLSYPICGLVHYHYQHFICIHACIWYIYTYVCTFVRMYVSVYTTLTTGARQGTYRVHCCMGTKFGIPSRSQESVFATTIGLREQVLVVQTGPRRNPLLTVDHQEIIVLPLVVVVVVVVVKFFINYLNLLDPLSNGGS